MESNLQQRLFNPQVGDYWHDKDFPILVVLQVTPLYVAVCTRWIIKYGPYPASPKVSLQDASWRPVGWLNQILVNKEAGNLVAECWQPDWAKELVQQWEDFNIPPPIPPIDYLVGTFPKGQIWTIDQGAVSL